MNPAELSVFLETLVRHEVQQSLMIWGPPGIGKSSIVAQTAAAHGLERIDLRLSQLAPTDRVRSACGPRRAGALVSPGVSARHRARRAVSRRDQHGAAQQLILDRRVGSYSVPEGWFIWAAGNRDEDSAAVFEMPAPLANRFLHVEVTADLVSFKQFALASGLSEALVAFLSFRPNMLHRFDAAQPAWPSPRSWAMADVLHRIGLDVGAAVGAAAAEFRAYQALRWLVRTAGPEWVQLCAADLLRQLRRRGEYAALLGLLADDEALQAWLAEHGLE